MDRLECVTLDLWIGEVGEDVCLVDKWSGQRLGGAAIKSSAVELGFHGGVDEPPCARLQRVRESECRQYVRHQNAAHQRPQHFPEVIERVGPCSVTRADGDELQVRVAAWPSMFDAKIGFPVARSSSAPAASAFA